ERYKNAALIIKNNKDIKNKKELIDKILKKIALVDQKIKLIREKSSNPDISKENQDLIKKLFSFSKAGDKDVGELEGAIALAKFGLYEKAIDEFDKLLEKENNYVKIMAAQNIIRCFISVRDIDKAISKYNFWVEKKFLPIDEIKKIKKIIEIYLDKKGEDKSCLKSFEPEKIPEKSIEDFDIFDFKEEPSKELSKASDGEIVFEEFDLIESIDKKEEPIQNFEYENVDEYLDIITSISITFDKGTKKSRKLEIDINVQTGNIINLIIPKNHSAFVKELSSGSGLNDIYCYSPMADFEARGVITAKNIITYGTKSGDYSLDIKLMRK
ncbi:MAG: hypothetical protein HQK78_15480, partial [Desulfobacterales bacterium]|nr:hypothetical protein [Desulfobacterales bacterium]